MGIVKLQDALKTIIIDYGENILDNSRKAKAFLGDYTGDESKDENQQPRPEGRGIVL